MKKISSKKKSSRRNQIILGVVLVFVMFGSVFGIVVNSFGQNTDSGIIKYNGFEFVEQNGFWVTKIGNLDFVFRNNPKEVENIDGKMEISLENYYDKPIYIDSKNYEANSEIYNNLGGVVLRIQAGCFEEPCEENVPIKTCEENLIVIKIGDKESITTDGNCVFIQGPESNLTAITDEFLFKLVGIK